MNNIENIILQQYAQLTVFLSQVFDSNHEFALLDLRPEHRCITAIANGHNSGRQVNAPITDLALSFIQEERWKETPFVCNYTGLSNGKHLVSSSFFIVCEGQLLGMFCINIHAERSEEISKIYQESLELTRHLKTLLPDAGSDEKETAEKNVINENFTNSLSERLEQAIALCLPYPSIPLNRLTHSEKMSVVGSLNDMGFFRIKGSVSETAKRLKCSEATIYRYLSKLEKK
ncbi:MAG: PAS domain-containing protein [Lachnospiraceae bacterium]|nr:PAS domain-containing protein [Lachnospiraceae bacterium]